MSFFNEEEIKQLRKISDKADSILKSEFKKFSMLCEYMEIKEAGYGREKVDLPNCTHKEHLTVKYCGHMDYIACSVNDCPLLK